MRFSLAVWIIITTCSPASAGMMGNGMHGGMMGGDNITPATPPPQNAGPTLRRGYDLTRSFCSQCHVVPSPQQHNAGQWPQVVARMQNYMHQQNRPTPSVEQKELILKYLGSQDNNQ